MISELFSALRAGDQLRNSTSWKNVQLTTGAVSALLGAVVVVLPYVGVHFEITQEQILGLAGGIAAVLGMFNSYTTAATSKTVGLPPSNEAPPAPKNEEQESARNVFAP